MSYNPLLSCLSEQALINIIYDSCEIKTYRPGQLICQMSKKSVLNKNFNKLYS